MNSIWRVGLFAWALLLPLSPWAQTVQVVTETTLFVFMQDGKIAGPATEVVKKTLQLAGINDYRLNIYPWARAYDMALNEPNVLIYLVARTPERETRFHSRYWRSAVLMRSPCSQVRASPSRAPPLPSKVMASPAVPEISNASPATSAVLLEPTLMLAISWLDSLASFPGVRPEMSSRSLIPDF